MYSRNIRNSCCHQVICNHVRNCLLQLTDIRVSCPRLFVCTRRRSSRNCSPVVWPSWYLYAHPTLSWALVRAYVLGTSRVLLINNYSAKVENTLAYFQCSFYLYVVIHTRTLFVCTPVYVRIGTLYAVVIQDGILKLYCTASVCILSV